VPDNLLKLRHRLLCRIGRRYKVVTEQAQFGPLCFPFTRIVDPDRVLDEVAAEADLRDRLAGQRAGGDQLHLPYWAELWESGRGVGEFLVGESSAKCKVQSAKWGENAGQSDRLPSLLCTLHSALCSSFDVLDLGCGMGMAGTVAAALGARVVFADLEAPCLLFARLNSLPWRRRVRTRRLDWKRDQLPQRFQLIVGADILYERDQWTWLDVFWRNHLAVGGRIILGEPGRQTGDAFIDWITTRGWQLTLRQVSHSTRTRPIRIFIIS
jgi:SAM-dependent methyltransferase